MKFTFTKISKNQKTGPIPTTSSPRETCPPSCPLQGAQGCYAEAGFRTRLHWDRIDRGEVGVEWPEFLKKIDDLPAGQLWRHNVAGDLRGKDGIIDRHALRELSEANHGRKGFTYTHYPRTAENVQAIEEANAQGFRVNVSCDTVTQAVAATQVTTAPVVSILPVDAPDAQKVDGVSVLACPAETKDTDCWRCGWCQMADRKFIIGFRAHGARKKAVDVIARG